MSQSVDIHALAGPYALNAVTEIERAGFARHLAECEACATEVAELGETAARLSVATRATPPSRLRGAVLAEVGRTRQLSAARTGRGDRASARRLGRGRVPWSNRMLGAVAAAFVLIVGVGAVWIQQQRLDAAQRQYEALQEAQERTGQILAAGDAELHSVSLGGGTVTVAVSDRLGDGVVLMENLPTPPEGRVYQVWRIADGAPTSIGVFDEGQRTGAVPMGTLGGADTVGVTLEPPGGSATPTLPIVADVSLA
jgi:anti-sigma-K factor RskA